MTNITIPPEALEAAAEAIRKIYYDDAPILETPSKDAARTACLAMLQEWQTEKHKMIVGKALDEVGGTYPAIILPLTESSDDK